MMKIIIKTCMISVVIAALLLPKSLEAKRNDQITDFFNGKSLDKNKWTVSGAAGTFLGKKPNRYVSDNVFVSDGKLFLKMTNVPDDPEGRYMHGSAVKSVHKYKYGYLALRAKVPDTKAVSSFFLYRHIDTVHSNHSDCLNKSMDLFNEIDIMEYGNGKNDKFYNLNKFHTNIHHRMDPLSCSYFSNTEKITFPANAHITDDFQLYVLYWDEDIIQWYIGEKLVRQVPNTHWHEPMRVNIGFGVNTNWLGDPKDENFPLFFEIDFIWLGQK